MAVSASTRRRGRPSTSEVAKIDARGRLLAAGARLFAARGYDAATVAAIVATAKLSKGTFYWHFAGKEQLLLALIEERLDRPLREVATMLATSEAGEDMAAAANRRLLKVLEADPDVVLLEHEYWALAARRPEIRRRYRRRQRELRRALGGALETRARTLGAPPLTTPPEEVATTVVALIAGISRARVTDPDGVPDHLVAEALALIYAGLVARAERKGRDR